MFILGIILFIIIALVFQFGIFVCLLPALIGLGILILSNVVSKSTGDNFAPLIVNISTIVVTIVASVLFWKDMFDDSIDVGPLPFIILLIYGMLALAICNIHLGDGRGTRKKDYSSKKNSPAPKKQVVTVIRRGGHPAKVRKIVYGGDQTRIVELKKGLKGEEK